MMNLKFIQKGLTLGYTNFKPSPLFPCVCVCVKILSILKIIKIKKKKKKKKKT